MVKISSEDCIQVILHDLRSPINNLLSLNQLFKDELEALSLEKQLDYPGTVSYCCNQALRMIDELMFSTLLATELPAINAKSTSLNKLIENQLRLFNTQVQQKQIRLHSKLPSKELFTLLDEDKFERCLQNLLSNALKFTPENGKISLSLTRNDNVDTIAITDTGIGIPEEMIPHLFAKFTPASREGLNRENSHGLGLFSTKSLVEMHGGNLRVESRVGKGSSFMIDLPIHSQYNNSLINRK